MNRPSPRELFKKIAEAKELVTEGQVLIIHQEILAEDAIELGYEVAELQKVLSTILEEVDPQHYVGMHPPQRSYESNITGAELFAFRWLSRRFGCEVYLKFTLKERCLYLVSLHEHREQ
jgi:hypothetical protein